MLSFTSIFLFGASASWDPSSKLRNTPHHLKARMAALARGPSSCSAPGGGLRATPTEYGGDPTGTVDSTAAVQKALQFCINASNHIPGKFPVGARDAGGCTVDLEGGEFLISDTLLIPTYVSDIQIARGALVANPLSKAWRVEEKKNAVSCPGGTFPVNRTAQWCGGLHPGSAQTQLECEALACSTGGVNVWQWCAAGQPCYATTSNQSCWLGAAGASAACTAAIPTSNKSKGWVGASRVAAPTPAPTPWSGKFMIQVGGDVRCNHPQGSCNEDVGFPQLFLDGSHVAGGIQVTSVMGTTIGPTTYILNFTHIGIEVNGGHEVMITETWLGETNFDYIFNQTTGHLPTATAIMLHSNDHYILNTIVFSSLIGLNNAGAANMITGLHVWFPENKALQFGCTAFLNTGASNRYDGCYIDGSVAHFANPSDTMWLDGFVLGGAGFTLSGASASNFVLTNTVFRGGKVQVDAGMKASNVWIGQNPSAKQASAVTKSTTSVQNCSVYAFDFCSELIFDTIETIKSVTFSGLQAASVFPVLTVGGVSACPGAPTSMRMVNVYLSTPAAGTVTLSVDSSTQDV